MSPPSPRQLCFFHVRKTGGTTLTAMLNDFVPPQRVSTPLAIGGFDQDPEVGRRGLRDALLVHGHTDFSPFLSPDAFRCTVLREPMARLRSERRQWTQAGPQDISVMIPPLAAAVQEFQRLTLAGILQRVFAHHVAILGFWNHQALLLGGLSLIRRRSVLRPWLDAREHAFLRYFHDTDAARDWLHESRAGILDAAIGRLRSMDYVGIREDFEVSAHEVFTRIGLPIPDIVPHLNVREAYADETAAELESVAAPFLELDYALYDEARSLHARAGRSAPSPRVDYIERTVEPGERQRFSAHEPPGGHGWHVRHIGADGRASRWTGPRSTFAVTLKPGRYRVELRVLGAVSEACVLGTTVSVNGVAAATDARVSDDGRWLVGATFDVIAPGLHDLRFDVPGTVDGYGLEVESIEVASMPDQPAPVVDQGGLERAASALAAMDRESVREGDVVRLFGEVVRDVVGRLDMPDLEHWRDPDACTTVDDMFAAFADVIAAASACADVAELQDRPWEGLARRHATYALRWLADVTVPPVYRPLHRRAEALAPGTPAFAGMVWEAALNLTGVLAVLAAAPPPAVPR